ncbi:hypothetical protein LINPERPRIM_LOCUS35995 [Linum perenne]
MKMAWSLDIKKFCIRTDLKIAISTLTSEVRTTHQHYPLVLEFQELLSRQWDVKLTHVFQEANHAADYLANLGHTFDFGVLVFFILQILLCVTGLDTIFFWRCFATADLF